MNPRGLPPITLASNTSVNVTGDPATVLQVAEGTITQREANPRQTAQVQTEQAAELATGVVEAIKGVEAAVEKARLEMQPVIPPPPRLFPGGDQKVLNPPGGKNL